MIILSLLFSIILCFNSHLLAQDSCQNNELEDTSTSQNSVDGECGCNIDRNSLLNNEDEIASREDEVETTNVHGGQKSTAFPQNCGDVSLHDEDNLASTGQKITLDRSSSDPLVSKDQVESNIHEKKLRPSLTEPVISEDEVESNSHKKNIKPSSIEPANSKDEFKSNDHKKKTSDTSSTESLISKDEVEPNKLDTSSIDQRILAEVVSIPGGEYHIGTNEPFFPQDGESPERKVRIASFGLDKYEVANWKFRLFVDATGYVTQVSVQFGFFFVSPQYK